MLKTGTRCFHRKCWKFCALTGDFSGLQTGSFLQSGTSIGFFSILHTWGQNLMHHPHVHCVVTGGGIDTAQQRWVSCRKNFFLSVRVLSRLFRRLFLEQLAKAELSFHGQLAATRKQDWVVYAKAPFGGPEKAIEYLGRYTHKVATGQPI